MDFTLANGGLFLDIVKLESIHKFVVRKLIFLLSDPEIAIIGFKLFRLNLVLFLDVFECFLDIFLQSGLFVLMLELEMFDFLFHLIQLHDMLLLQLFYLGLFIQ